MSSGKETSFGKQKVLLLEDGLLARIKKSLL